MNDDSKNTATYINLMCRKANLWFDLYMLALVLLVISIGVGVLSPARFDWVVCVSILVLLGTALLCHKLGDSL